jgi:hypothetical protein
MQDGARSCAIPTTAWKEDESMTESNIQLELKRRLSQDIDGAWKRIQAYYQKIGQSSRLDNYAGFGWPEFNDPDPYYGLTLQDFTYSTPDVAQVPVIARTATFQNDGDETAQEDFTFTKTITESFTFGFTEGLSVGTKASGKIGLPLVAEGELELHADVTFEANQQWTTTESREWSSQTTVPIPPHQTVKVTGFVTNANINTTFSGRATATKGLVGVWCNLKGSNSHDMISVPLTVLLPDDDMRSVPVSGTFHGVEGISTYTHVEIVKG